MIFHFSSRLYLWGSYEKIRIKTSDNSNIYFAGNHIDSFYTNAAHAGLAI